MNGSLSVSSEEQMTQRILLIGLDGATFDLIDPWVAEGKLPTLGRLLAEGTSAPLETVPNMNSAPAWSSFATGMNPGKHGIFYFDERVPGSYESRYVNGGSRDGTTFWRLLSEAGRRVVAMNVPMTYPAEPVNGIVIAGLDTPTPESPGFTSPPDVAARLRREVGDYIIEPGIPSFIKAGRRDLAVQRLHECTGKRTAWARHLLRHEDWEFFAVVFTSTDAAHHFFWKDFDPTHPDHDPLEAERFGNVIFDVYRRLDEVVADLIKAAGSDATVIIMSDHGGGFNQRGGEFLNPWLTQLGYRVPAESAGPSQPWSWQMLTGRARQGVTSVLGSAYRQLDRRLSRDMKLRLAARMPAVRRKVEAAVRFQGTDWSRTRAYAHGVRDEIWINLRGREPSGIVNPGAEYHALLEELTEQLYAVRDPVRGEPVVDAVWRREEIYHGPHSGKAADLTIRWRTDFVLSGLQSQKALVKASGPAMTNGGHRPFGILIARGNGIPAGQRVTGARLMDLAPTILALMGEPIPDNLDGHALTAIVGQRDLVYTTGRGLTGGVGYDYEIGEAEIVQDRLRGMGYIE